MRVPRTPLVTAALVAASAAGVMVGASAGTHSGSCIDPATHAVVIPGDGVRNDNTDFVCTGGALVSYSKPRPLPSGVWWSTVTGHVGDCGPHKLTWRHPGVIVGYGPREVQSGLHCPPPPWGNGSVNPS